MRCGNGTFRIQNKGESKNISVSSDVLFGFSCYCPIGFIGELCETSLIKLSRCNEYYYKEILCMFNECGNGVNLGYGCKCTKKLEGADCSILKIVDVSNLTVSSGKRAKESLDSIMMIVFYIFIGLILFIFMLYFFFL